MQKLKPIDLYKFSGGKSYEKLNSIESIYKSHVTDCATFVLRRKRTASSYIRLLYR